MVRQKLTTYKKMTVTRYAELKAHMRKKANAKEISATASDNEESEQSDTVDSAATKRQATLALDSPVARTMAHRDRFARPLVEYAKEEQDRLRSRARERGAAKRLKLLNGANGKENQIPAKVPPEVIVISDDEE